MAKQGLLSDVGGMDNTLGTKSGGIGFSDRPHPEEDCSCPPMCYCCSQPLYYSSYDRKQMTPERSWRWRGCCWASWTAENIPILGSNVTYHGKMSCATMWCPMCSPAEIDVVDNGRSIGMVKMYFPVCGCFDKNTIWSEAFDDQGRSLYTRRDRLCCPTNFRFMADGCCSFMEIGHPIQGPRGEPLPSPERAASTFRFHTCSLFHTWWMGFKDFSPDVSDRDRKLLLAMAKARMWRMERNQKQQQQDATMV